MKWGNTRYRSTRSDSTHFTRDFTLELPFYGIRYMVLHESKSSLSVNPWSKIPFTLTPPHRPETPTPARHRSRAGDPSPEYTPHTADTARYRKPPSGPHHPPPSRSAPAGNNLVIAGHHRHRAKLQSLYKMHRAEAYVSADGPNTIVENAVREGISDAKFHGTYGDLRMIRALAAISIAISLCCAFRRSTSLLSGQFRIAACLGGGSSAITSRLDSLTLMAVTIAAP